MQFQCNFSAISVQFQCCFRAILGQFQGNFSAVLVRFQCNIGAVSVLFQSNSRAISRQFPGNSPSPAPSSPIERFQCSPTKNTTTVMAITIIEIITIIIKRRRIFISLVRDSQWRAIIEMSRDTRLHIGALRFTNATWLLRNTPLEIRWGNGGQ